MLLEDENNMENNFHKVNLAIFLFLSFKTSEMIIEN